MVIYSVHSVGQPAEESQRRFHVKMPFMLAYVARGTCSSPPQSFDFRKFKESVHFKLRCLVVAALASQERKFIETWR